MTAEQLVVIGLLVAAFAAGWFARGDGDEGKEEPEPEVGAPEPPDGTATRTAPAAAPARPRTTVVRPDPAHDAARALAFAVSAYEKALDRWLDERDAISPAGRAAVGELERAVHRLDHAAARLDEVDETLGDAAYDALEALRHAARHLETFREGRALDAATSRELDRLEDELARARGAFGSAGT